jgi:hypothetical protein
MTTIADALATLTAEATGLFNEIARSNVQFVHGIDTGAANHLNVSVTPSIAVLSDDIIIGVDVATTNTVVNPDLTIDTFNPMPILWMDGTALAVGDLTGFCLFKIANTGGVGGPVAKLINPTVSSISNRITAAGLGGGGGGGLTVVTHDATLTGLGTVASPLGVVPFAVKAWGLYQSGVLTQSYNVSSVASVGGGVYAVYFTNPLTDANYAVLANSLKGGQSGGIAGTWVNEYTGSPRSSSAFSLMAFGLYLGITVGAATDFTFVVLR